MIDDRAETGEQRAADRLSVSEAAERLGLSTDAIRSRLRRGTLDGGKDGDLWYVILPPEEGQDDNSPQQEPDRREVGSERDALVDQLRDENAYLREQLAAMIRQTAEANERADILQARLMDRLPTGDRQDDQPEATGSTETNGTPSQGELHRDEASTPQGSIWRRLRRVLRGS